jgi:MauM/NapG family ferredoxin protein
LISLQRIIQGFSLAVFIAALWRMPQALLTLWPVDGFVRLDPLVFLGTALSDREFAPLLWIAGAVLLLSLILGRFFCAYLCPLGSTLDLWDRLLRSRRKHPSERPAGLPTWGLKYHLLLFILGAGTLGISLVFLASPLSMVTRLYGWIIYPLCAFLADLGLVFLRPLADPIDYTTIVYAVVKVPRYDLQWVTFSMLAVIFAGGLWSSRFWCRYLCPSGALLALFSFKPFLRRQVSADCTHCGHCVARCPMGAIGEGRSRSGGQNPFLTRHSECIACQSCVRICPTQAVAFTIKPQRDKLTEDEVPSRLSRPNPADRRWFLTAGLSGAAAAMVSLVGLKSPHSNPGPGSIMDPAVIRPPGAVPENDFLARCIRCGACLTTCPTNTLQPLGLQAGLTAIFSPVITPRRGPCDPGCNICGTVCPTGAISNLSLTERRCAKVGTAYLNRQKCLAWELAKKCLICDEVCPFDAVEFRVIPGHRIAVPFINENRCSGCGYCEHHCPVRSVPAIVVEPMLALRLSGGSYCARAREMGYSFKNLPKPNSSSYFDEISETPPAIGERPERLPPGFTE